MSHYGPFLGELLARFPKVPGLAALAERLPSASTDEASLLYVDALSAVEAALWARHLEGDALGLFQGAFREYEALIASRGADDRRRFIVVVPVADRPQHLRNFLESLLALCDAYGYGGMRDGRFAKVTVVVADDSADQAVIGQNRRLVAEFEGRGLDTIHFGAEQQAQELDALAGDREELARVLAHPERTGFGHKGASITRNVTYLFLRRLIGDDRRTLVWFVDSDEQFKVRTVREGQVADLAAINYFHHLDRVFSEREVHVLTGKVVGDPPVSPSVMAGNFLADVTSFLRQVAAVAPETPCRFHDGGRHSCDDAAYHDMADLFGFKQAEVPYVYHCGIAGPHDHGACLRTFAARLDGFFHGEHPTRETYFEFGKDFPAVKPARTVYTGNYVFDAEGLRYFIPFAPLKLRMAGPVLGRIIKAEIGPGFVSANLPLLHTRTVEGEERFEFRPGVRREESAVDLSGEFERQFFGDVMLFSIERLTGAGYPGRLPDASEIDATLESVEAEMTRRYRDKQAEISKRIDAAQALVTAPEQWWNRGPGHGQARSHLERFLSNLRNNFGEEAKGHRCLRDFDHRSSRLREIRDAIVAYGDDRQAWEAVMGDSR